MARLILGSLGLLSVVTLVLSCSSGIGKNVQRPTPAASVLNPNRVTGLDLGFTPTSAASEPSVAGVVVPAIGSTPQRDVVLMAFSTAAAANDGDGTGRPISRDAVVDSNGSSDVFVAALSAQDIETRAFSQSLAGKFRHPRCTTCHSMQASDSLAFASSPQPHAGPTPGPTFPNNRPSECTRCHGNAEVNAQPTPLWQAPAASFDFRRKTVAQLAEAASDAPTGDLTHFQSDPRVLWALDIGILPTFGGRNGVADDDHDGVLEPEDTDGTPRPVPGGSAVLLSQIQAWIDSGRVVTTADAVKDVTLASRASGNTNASNGASGAAKVLWVPNGSFDPTSSATARATNPVGTLYVVYQSTGSDITGTDTNLVSDVYRVAIQLRAEEDATGGQLAGGLNLVYVADSAVLCSAKNGTTVAGNGASTQPSIGGSTADVVAFTSLATDLITAFVNANGTGADVYVHKVGTQLTTLLSHSLSSTSTSGNGHSEGPAVASSGVVVAFETDASNLVASDTNGVRDVYHTTVSGFSPFIKTRSSVTAGGAQATGGGASKASVHEGSSRVRVAFQSDATNMTTGLVATTNVYLFDSTTSASTLLNQKSTTTAAAIGDDDARAPVISSDGSHIVFESEASNIDVVRTTDLNHASDLFVVATAQLNSRVVAPSRISVTSREGADGNGASSGASFGSFTGSASYPVGFVAYTTAATNLGTSDSTSFMLGFLNESTSVTKSSPTANFTASASTGVAPAAITFTDTSTQLPTSWAWDFGDSSTSTQQSPTHTYSTPGTYTVRLDVTNEAGTSFTTSTVTIFAPVIAGFTTSPSPATGPSPLTVSFTNTSTGATSYVWDFGDGSATVTTANASHVYSSGGTFTATLTATGPGGTSVATASVASTSTATFTMTSTNNGSAVTSLSEYTGNTVSFTGAATGATSFQYDFGDGAMSSTSASPNASHSYSVASFPSGGTDYYTVTFTAFGAPGGTVSTTHRVRIVASSEQATFNPSADASIYEEATGNSNGAGSTMFVGRTNGSLAGGVTALSRRSLVLFNIVPTVPAGSTVNSASLRLTVTVVPGTSPAANTIGAHRVNSASSWTEGTTNAGGQGATASGGGVTWARRTTPSTLWSTAGGDFNATATSSVTVNAAGNYTITGLGTNVQSWVTGGTGNNNNGWLLKGSESTLKSVRGIASREDATVANRPLLTVNFRRPLPSAP